MRTSVFSGLKPLYVRRCLVSLGALCCGTSPVFAQNAPTGQTVPVPPVTMTPQVVPKINLTPPPSPSGVATTKSLDSINDSLNVKGMNLAFPSFDQTITQDAGGFRSTLAKYGIGFEMVSQFVIGGNFLNTPKSTQGKQAYLGQQVELSALINPFLTFDLSRFGIPDGQIVVAGTIAANDLHSFVPHNASLFQLSYYQSLFNNHIQVKIGYIPNALEYVGVYTAGQIAGSIFGPSAIIPFELGLSGNPQTAPGVNVTFNLTGNAPNFGAETPNLYNKVGVQRSVSPTPNDSVDDANVNPTGFRFVEPGAGVVFIDEVGYRKVVSGIPQTWIRIGGIHNTSGYLNFRTGGKSTNSGFYVLGDQQLWQPIKSGPARALGLYAGFSVNYAAPDTNVFTRYYEARLYAIGLVPGRPRDIGGIVVTYNKFSPAFAKDINRIAPFTGIFARADSTSETISYAARVLRGIYLTSGLTYTNNPSPTFNYREGHAFAGTLQLTLVN